MLSNDVVSFEQPGPVNDRFFSVIDNLNLDGLKVVSSHAIKKNVECSMFGQTSYSLKVRFGDIAK